MSEKPSFPPLDLYAMQFPSDKVTLGQARKIDRELNGDGVFSSSHRLNFAHAPTDILAVIPLTYEFELAEKAYAKALGLPDPLPHTTRAELVNDLRREWKQDGISSGPQQSTQFIRDIERDAKRQAEQHLGKRV
jgi:hypothetical protein